MYSFITFAATIMKIFKNLTHDCLPPTADNWTSAEMVDCILSYAVTVLVENMTDPTSEDGQAMLARVRSDARGSKQVRLPQLTEPIQLDAE